MKYLIAFKGMEPSFKRPNDRDFYSHFLKGTIWPNDRDIYFQSQSKMQIEMDER